MLIIANITQKNEGKDLNLMSDVNLKKKDWESYFKEGNGMETAKYKMIHDEKCAG